MMNNHTNNNHNNHNNQTDESGKIMSACIIDDEQNVRNSIRNLIITFDLPINIIGEAGNVADALELLQTVTPDLLFLDVEMPDGKGFDLLRQKTDIAAKVIFITAHNYYAVDAFRFSALDFLLKPIDAEELQQAITKAQIALDRENQEVKITTFLEYFEKDNKDKKLILKTTDKMYILEISKIIRLESSSNYTTFFVEDNQQIMVAKSIKEYEELLVNYGFFRIHQSNLVNLSFLSMYDKRNQQIMLKDGALLPVATRKAQDLVKILDQI